MINTPRQKKNYRLWIIWLYLILFTALLISIHLKLQSYAFDDAYIHFRIANHLVEYGKPYFNPSEAVMASSSTGWTIILGAITWILKHLDSTTSLPTVVAVINALACVSCVIIYLHIFKAIIQKEPSTVLQIAFCLLFMSTILRSSIGLMETPLVIAITGLSLLMLYKENRWGIALSAALPFFRVELVVVSGLTILFILITRRFRLVEVVGLFTLGALPFISYELFFFHTLIPNTITAKSVIYSLTYTATFRYFIAKIFDDLALLNLKFHLSLSQALIYAGYSIWTIASILIIFSYQTIRRSIKDSRLEVKELYSLLLLLWFLGIAGAYLYKRVFIFSWYDPLYAIPLFILIWKIVVDSKPKRIQLVLGIMLLPLIFGQGSKVMQILMGAYIDPVYTPEFLNSARVRNYIEVGRNLYVEYPNATLMTSEIGGLGYGFSGYIYDGAGLVSPDALRFQPLGGVNAFGGIPKGFVEEKKPDLIVGYDVFLLDLKNSNILEDYVRVKYPLLLADDLVRVGDEGIFQNSEALNVYIRKGLIKVQK